MSGVRDRSVAGFTLLELLIAVGLFTVITASIFTCLGVSQSAMVEGSAQGDMEFTARRVLDRIAQDFRAGVLTTLKPFAPTASSSASVSPATGYANGAVTLGTAISYAWISDPQDPVNGKDDDHDGSIDEGSVVRSVGAEKTTIASNVKSLSFTLAQNDLACTITLERTIRGKRRIAFSDSIQVRFRN
jgi:type II secretory pathway pseudopilin PulG